MSLLQSGTAIALVCMLVCMLAAACYLLFLICSRARRNMRIILNAPVAGAFAIFGLSFFAALILLLTGSPLFSETLAPRAGTTQAFAPSDSFDHVVDELALRLSVGRTDSASAKVILDRLSDQYDAPTDGAQYRSALALLDAAQKGSRYLDALQAGDYATVDRLVRFYYEDYQQNSSYSADLPEYRLMLLFIENKTLVGDVRAAGIIQKHTSGYIDYCLQCPATKTRLEILFHLSYLLRELGFVHSQADVVSLKANHAMRVLSGSGLSSDITVS
ncbi:MAG: hypothetical protein ACERKO_07665 [Acetanaerobacterium sp.]